MAKWQNVKMAKWQNGKKGFKYIVNDVDAMKSSS
jgi:hypothetical protein